MEVVRIGMLLFAFFYVSADASDTPTQHVRSATEIIERIRQEFRRARFNKPGNRDGESIEQKFAPLIVEEIGPRLRPGITAGSRLAPDNQGSKGAAVFFSRCAAIAQADTFEGVAFFWWHDAIIDDCLECGLQRRGFLNRRGVRVFLGPDGMPILWEALEHPSNQRVFYASQSLETAAKAQFGGPLAGRNFSIEKRADETADIVVARVLDDGPVPMGPYVYIDASCNRSITTLLCRCMASQFDEVVEPVVEYQLEPLESLDEKWLRENGGIDLKKLMEPEPLDKLFRWPKL